MPAPALLAGTLAALFLIGFGPALSLVSGPRRRAQAALLAPVLGLALLGLALYPLVRADVTVGVVARPLTLLGALLSGALALRDRRRGPAAEPLDGRAAFGATAGAVGVAAALSVSAVGGGLGHTLWQGNETDAGFYLGVAAYAKDVPWSWLPDPARDQDVVQRSVAAAGGIGMAAGGWRPAAALTVAWAAALWGRPVTDVYYVVALLGPALAFTTMLAVAARLGLRGPGRVAPAVVTATGFWAFALVDMNATGQALALPLSILVMFAWLPDGPAGSAPPFSRESALLAVALAALFGFYAEMMPLLLVAFGLCAAIRWRELGTASAARAAAIVLMATTCVAPALGAHLSYLQGVSSAALRTREGWAEYFFPWLLDGDPTLSGLWGLHFWRVAARGFTAGALGWPLFAVVVGGGLTLALVVTILRALQPHHRVEAVLAAAVGAFWGGALLLLLLREPWLAGKAFGYGSPFACAAVFVALESSPARVRPWAAALAIAWTLTQASTFAWRLPATRPGGEPIPGYVRLRTEGLDEIARLDLDRGPVAADLSGAPPAQRRAWTLVLSSRADFLPLHSVPGRLGRPLWREAAELPERLLVVRERADVGALGTKRPAQATETLALYQMQPPDYDLALLSSRPLAASGPQLRDSIECDAPAPGEPLRCWTLGRHAGVRFLASGERPLRAVVEMVPLAAGRWWVLANGAPGAEFIGAAGVAARVAFPFTPRRGTNWIRFALGDGAGEVDPRAPRGPQPRTAALDAVGLEALP